MTLSSATMKTSRKQNLLADAVVCAMAFVTTPLLAQDGASAVAATKLPESLERPPYRPWIVGIEAGTSGIFGGSASWRFSDHLGTRLGVDYAEASWHHLGIAGVHYDAKLRLLSEPLTLDWYPWQKHSFHLSLGVLFNQNELTGTASDTGSIIINGQLNMKVQQQPVNPYISIGGNFFYFDHAHHWALGGELGVAYFGEAKVSLSGPGAADAVLNGVQNGLQRYADQYQWWPVAKLNVSYSF
jgi:hypothetical protein